MFLSTGCDAPVARPQERCFAQYNFNYAARNTVDNFFDDIEKYKKRPEMRKEFLRDVLQIFGKARCNLYDLNKVSPVNRNGGYDRPLSHMDLFGGFSAKAWAKEITPWGRESLQYYRDACRRKKKRREVENEVIDRSISR